MREIPFNRVARFPETMTFLQEALDSDRISGDGAFMQRVHEYFGAALEGARVLMTPSGTAALEMMAYLIDVGPGDEVIMPSYTFVSTANAFVLRGARIRFVDVEPGTMNVDPACIEAAITDRTRAIVPVHYAGVSCDIAAIEAAAADRGIVVLEDAAQAFQSTWRDRPVGVRSPLAAFSFHESKNFTSGGEGGLLILNDHRYVERAELLREKGTDRSRFFRGEVDKYTWMDLGSSLLPGELQAAHLFSQLIHADEVLARRRAIWADYGERLASLAAAGRIELPVVPADCAHNGHMFFIKCADTQERSALIAHLRALDIHAVFHYVPLHSSKAGRRFGDFAGADRHTTREAGRLLRLPLYFDLSADDIARVTDAIHGFYA